MLIVIFGLPGTGKSFVGERLAERLGIIYINSDRLRQEMQLMRKYGSEEKQLVYQQMLHKAEKCLRQGKDVLLDATFSQRAYLHKAKALAQQYNTSCKFIEMVANEKVIRERVSQSRKYSEADYEVYKKMKENYEATEEAHLVLDTSAAKTDHLIQQASEYLYHD